MAVPFRKVSKTRRDMRRTHYKITANGLVECSNCGAKIRPHRACPKCGFYKGADTSKVVETKVAEEKKAPKKAKTSKIKKEVEVKLLTPKKQFDNFAKCFEKLLKILTTKARVVTIFSLLTSVVIRLQ